MSVTVSEALQLPIMKRTKLIAGQGGLDRQIKWVTIVEVIEDVRRLQQGEFLITTAYGLESDPVGRKRLIEQLAKRNLSALAIHTGFYLQAIPDDFKEIADRYQLPLFEIPSELNFSMITRELLEQVVNHQLRSLEYSERVHKELIEVALANQSFHAIAEVLAKQTHACVYVFDTTWKIEARSSSVHHATEEYLYSRILAELEQTRISSELETSGTTVNVRYMAHSVDDRIAIWNVTISPIMAGGHTFGYLTLAKEGNPISELDLLAVGHATTVCALEFMKRQAVKNARLQQHADLLTELLQEPILLSSDLMERITSAGLDPAKPHTIALIGTQAPVSKETLDVVHMVIEKGLDEFGVRSIHKRSLHTFTVLLESDQEINTNVIKSLESIRKHAQGLPLKIGLGRTVSDIRKLAQSAREAEIAFRYGSVLNDHKAIAKYDELGHYHLLIQMLESGFDLRPYWAEVLGRIIDQPFLVDTLGALFDTNMNFKKTSEILFVHRHTLKYRIQKIERMTGKSLSDPAERLQLQLAWMAHRLQSVATHSPPL